MRVRVVVGAVGLLLVISPIVFISVMHGLFSLEPKLIQPEAVKPLPKTKEEWLCHVVFGIPGTDREVGVVSKFDLQCWLVGNEYPVFEYHLRDTADAPSFHRPHFVSNEPLRLYRYKLPSCAVIENALYGPPGTAREFYHVLRDGKAEGQGPGRP